MDLNIRGAVDFFYTANEECLPDGPAFTLRCVVRVVLECRSRKLFHRFPRGATREHQLTCVAALRV